jgi:hypothetical protein
MEEEEEEDIRVKLVRASLVRVPVLCHRTAVMAMPTATATAMAMAADPGLLGDLLDGGDRCCGSIAGV